MSILHFKFVPHIAFFEPEREDQFGLSQIREVIYPTNNQQLDQLILPGLSNDRIKFKDNIPYSIEGLKPFHYEFNTQDNLIHIWYSRENNIPVDSEALSEALQAISPDEGGPDTWMEGDIQIVANAFGYGGIEMHPYLSWVSFLVPDPQKPGYYKEYQVDTSKL